MALNLVGSKISDLDDVKSLLIVNTMTKNDFFKNTLLECERLWEVMKINALIPVKVSTKHEKTEIMEKVEAMKQKDEKPKEGEIEAAK